MTSSPSPEIFSPANSPSIQQPIIFSPPAPPQQPTVSPFPSPLPPSFSPATSPPPDIPLSPEIPFSPPPPPLPVPTLPLPPPAPVPIPATTVSPPPVPLPALPFSPPTLPPPIPSEPPPESPLLPPPSTAAPPPETSEIPNSPPSEPSPTITPPAPLVPSTISPTSPTPLTPSTIFPAPTINPPPEFMEESPPAPDSPPSLATPPSVTTPTPPTPSYTSGNEIFPAAVQVRKTEPNMRVSPGFIAGSVVVSLVVVLVVVAACVVFGKRQRRRNRKSLVLPQHYQMKPASSGPKDNFSTMANLQSTPSTTDSVAPPGPSHGVFSYEQLVAATDRFSESNLLGEGGFGRVYKGVVGPGKEVAVKQLSAGSHQGEREFQAEVDIISRIHHKHLVSLVGYCITGAERLLVYEFVPNNTLEFHLHENHQQVMQWSTRLKIAIGAAKGLAYLHEDCNPKIIHRDIKASNILLDFRFEAKVSDFGLAKSFSDTSSHISHISTRVVGTFGYLAPEYASSGKVTEKSDVYSYGVMLLELITGRPPISPTDPIRNQGLVDWARPLLAQAMDSRDFDNLADQGLGRNYDATEMSRMISCAAACVRHSAWLRPRMSQIVHALEGHAALTDLHEGIAPGKSTLYNAALSSSYNNALEYTNNSNRFHRTVGDQNYRNDDM